MNMKNNRYLINCKKKKNLLKQLKKQKKRKKEKKNNKLNSTYFLYREQNN